MLTRFGWQPREAGFLSESDSDSVEPPRAEIFEEPGRLNTQWFDIEAKNKHFAKYKSSFTSYTIGDFGKDYEDLSDRTFPETVSTGPWDQLPDVLRNSIKSWTEPIYRFVPHRLEDVFDGFVSTIVEALAREVFIEFHKPREERYILKAATVEDFL